MSRFNVIEEGLIDIKQTLVELVKYAEEYDNRPSKKDRVAAADRLIRAIQEIEKVYVGNSDILRNLLWNAHFDLEAMMTLTSLRPIDPDQVAKQIKADDDAWCSKDPDRCLTNLEYMSEQARGSIGLQLESKLVISSLRPLKDDLLEYTSAVRSNKGGSPRNKAINSLIYYLADGYHRWTGDTSATLGVRFIELCGCVLPNIGIKDTSNLVSYVERMLKSPGRQFLPIPFKKNPEG